MGQNPYILASDNSPALLPLLRSNPSLASTQDDHGYSLLHAAASYGHISLLRSLVHEFKVDINLTDEDGETCLFVVEEVPVAHCLVEELGIDKNIKNDQGLTAQDAIAEDGSFPQVAAYLRGMTETSNDPTDGILNTSSSLPPNMTMNMGTMTDQGDAGQEPDPEFRRRIEELASRDDFHTAEGQNRLRELVKDAVKAVDAETEDKDVRRRVE